MLPRVVKKMRKVDGEASMMEECTFLPFPSLYSLSHALLIYGG